MIYIYIIWIFGNPDARCKWYIYISFFADLRKPIAGLRSPCKYIFWNRLFSAIIFYHGFLKLPIRSELLARPLKRLPKRHSGPPANDIYIYIISRKWYIYISFTFCVRIFLRWILAHSLSKSYRWGKWCPWKVWYMSAFTHETIREILKQFWGGSKNQRFVTPYTGFGWNCVTIRSIIQMIYIYIYIYIYHLCLKGLKGSRNPLLTLAFVVGPHLHERKGYSGLWGNLGSSRVSWNDDSAVHWNVYI